ncbi:hypothetical protein [Thermoplasma acidophilum]|uniref:Peptide N-acetyl-beta-D-glucosaminyl asparaginase amidase A N-terminal domain-containing protein n=1 Tax=Thermoplasma acidophilum (strain ATCC 25905 / DSM 1728 / JCM 9062 / NBRC 15155 / AMRC-C165) TaxID=273075 RepID=Q9HIF5_THEAC|nr:hypothetical protein [Thermoplasma acidophilum]
MGKILRTLTLAVAVVVALVILGFGLAQQGFQRSGTLNNFSGEALLGSHSMPYSSKSRLLNLSSDALSESDPSGYPIYNSSTVLASLPPVIPNTQPVVVRLVHDFVVYRNNTSVPTSRAAISGSFIAPQSPTGWALILLKFNGSASGIVYDSGYSFNVDNNTLLWGTSPEYGNWTVYKNLTLYEALFTGKVYWQWNSPGTIVQGRFESNITLYFYPADAQFPAPKEPNLIIPILPSMSSFDYHLTPSKPYVTSEVKVPKDVYRAEIQIWLYGFSSQEFWYANEPSFNMLFVNVSSRAVASVLPFPYINTGGIDLFAWRPVTGAFTLHDRFYFEDVTGDLGFIEGTHEWNFSMPDLAYPYFVVTASLLLYTSPNASPATPGPYHFSMSPVRTVQVGIPGVSQQAYFNQSMDYSYSSTSVFRMDGRLTIATDIASGSFMNNQSLTPIWENLTQSERMQFVNIVWFGHYSSISFVQYNFPLRMDTLFEIQITKTTNGGYPMYGFATFGLTDLLQSWQQVSLSNHMITTIENTVTSNDSFVTSQLELISPTGGLLGAVSHASGFTSKDLRVSVRSVSSGIVHGYEHKIVAGSSDLYGPDYIQPILYERLIIVLNDYIISQH